MILSLSSHIRKCMYDKAYNIGKQQIDGKV